MRYNNTERIGVYSTAIIFENDIGWIFREQPLVDVGIDALVEVSEEGNPQGSFLAIQIKCGKGNFYENKNSLTYYVSNIHYYYWTKFDLPIILVGYIPEEKKAYWQHISTKNLEKSNKRWKIDLPKNKILNNKSIIELKSIIYKNNYNLSRNKINNNIISDNNIYELSDGIERLNEANSSVKNICSIINELNIKTKDNVLKLQYFIKIGLSDKDSQSISVFKSIAKSLNIFYIRLMAEVNIFSEAFAEGTLCFEKVIILLVNLTGKKEIINLILNSIQGIPTTIISTIKSLDAMLNSIKDLKRNNYIKIDKNNALLALETVIEEFKEAQNLSENLIISVKNLI